MYMKSDHIIYGKLELNEKLYPFFMQGQRATIIQIPIEDIKDFYCLDEVDKIVGVTNSNKKIALMNCRFSNSSKIALPYAGIVFSVAWYVEYDTEDLCFDKVCFTSSALNAFFPTIRQSTLRRTMNSLIPMVLMRFAFVQIKKRCGNSKVPFMVKVLRSN